MASPELQSLLWKATALGDAELLLPAVVGTTCALWFARQRDNARAIAIGLALCLGLTVGAKVALMLLWRGGPLRSPSGHAALAAFFYGTMAVALWRKGRNWFWRAGALALAMLVVAVAVSRFMIGGHSRTETVVGLAFGAACAFWLAPRLRPLRIKGAVDAIKGAVVGIAAGAFVWFVRTEAEIDEERIAAFARWLRRLIDGG